MPQCKINEHLQLLQEINNVHKITKHGYPNEYPHFKMHRISFLQNFSSHNFCVSMQILILVPKVIKGNSRLLYWFWYQESKVIVNYLSISEICGTLQHFQEYKKLYWSTHSLVLIGLIKRVLPKTKSSTK